MPEPLDFIKTISRQETHIMQNRILPRLVHAYVHLELPLDKAQELARKTIETCTLDKPMDHIEQQIFSLLKKNGAFTVFDQKMSLRALMWYQKIEPFIIGKNFLDLGGGDGRTAKRIKDELKLEGKSVDIHVADILDYPDRARDLPFTMMTGTNTSFKDNQFDTVFLGTVYHHCGKELDDPLKLVEESIRVTKKRLLVIESLYEDPKERLYNMWIDWFYNRVLHFSRNPREKVNVPFNFRKRQDWEKQFIKRKMKIIKSIDLRTFQTLNPEHHWLFVLEK